MEENNKQAEQAMKDALSTLNATASQEEGILDLAETDIVPQDEEKEELIDIKSFDESGDIAPADEQSQLLAKAQHGDTDAIEKLSKNIIDKPELETTSQGGVDELLGNLEKISQDSSVEQNVDLADKAKELESASKTYAEKDFSSSVADDTDEENEDSIPPKEASSEDLAQAMAKLTEQDKIQEEIAQQLTEKVNKTVALKAVPGVSGLQVGFPIEVLAEALRPMISGWIEDNLPHIVEKLVKEELSKLADK